MPKTNSRLPRDIKARLQAQKQRQFYVLTSLLILAAYIWISWHLYAGHKATNIGVCLSRNLLGIACPGCGTTRGVLAALHGHWQQALYYNPLSLLALAGLALLPFFLLYDFFKKENFTFRIYLAVERLLHKPAILIPVALLIALNWIWNIQKGI